MKGPNRQDSSRIVANGNQCCEWESKSSGIVANGNQNRRDRHQWELESSRSSRMGIVKIIANGNCQDRCEWESLRMGLSRMG